MNSTSDGAPIWHEVMVTRLSSSDVVTTTSRQAAPRQMVARTAIMSAERSWNEAAGLWMSVHMLEPDLRLDSAVGTFDDGIIGNRDPLVTYSRAVVAVGGLPL